jgi:hypothetical protein
VLTALWKESSSVLPRTSVIYHTTIMDMKKRAHHFWVLVTFFALQPINKIVTIFTFKDCSAREEHAEALRSPSPDSSTHYTHNFQWFLDIVLPISMPGEATPLNLPYLSCSSTKLAFAARTLHIRGIIRDHLAIFAQHSPPHKSQIPFHHFNVMFIMNYKWIAD